MGLLGTSPPGPKRVARNVEPPQLMLLTSVADVEKIHFSQNSQIREFRGKELFQTHAITLEPRRRQVAALWLLVSGPVSR